MGNSFSNGTTRDKLKIYLYSSGSTENYGFSVGANGDVQYHSNGTHDFYVGNSNRVRINSSGNVGIGTTTPNAPLSFGTGVADNKIYVYDGTSDKYGFGIRTNQFMIYSGAGGTSAGGITFGKFDGTTFTEYVRFTNSGNVGIGKSTPSGSLDVTGSVLITGSLSVTGSITSSYMMLKSPNTTSNAFLAFSGSLSSSIKLEVLQDGGISFIGNSGTLFGISDSLSGSLMSVNDVSGMPIFEVFSDERVVMGAYNQNVLVVTGSDVGIGKIPNIAFILDVSGSTAMTGSLNVSSGITGSLLGTASYATSALSSSYAITASYALNGGGGGGSGSSGTSGANGSSGTSGSSGSSGTSGSSGSSGTSGAAGSSGTSGNSNAASGSLNYIPRFNSGSVLTESSIFNTGSFVGIGKTNPSTTLDINGNTFITGALQVTGSITSSYIVLKSPNTSSNATMVFSGSLTSSISLEVLQNGGLSFMGANGSLFDISDIASGSLFSVNDISGLPTFEVFSDDKIVMGPYGSNLFVISGSDIGIGKAIPNPSFIMDINGNVGLTGSLFMSSGTVVGTSSFATSASYAASGWPISSSTQLTNNQGFTFTTSSNVTFGTVTSSYITLKSPSSTLNSTIAFSGSTSSSIRLEVLQDGSVSFIGSAGTLFGITDSLSGSLMNVSDITGLPILEVFSDDRVVMGKFGSNALVVSGSSFYGTGSILGTASYALNPNTMWIPASAWIPRTTSGSGINSLETTTNKINYDVLEFDAGAIEYAQAMTTMPSNWNLGNISANFYWTATGSSGAVVWRIAARSFADDNLIDALMGTAQSVTDTFITGSDMHISANTPAVTITGSNSTTNAVVYEISRNATDGADTLAVDAQLLGVKINFNI